MSLAAPRTVVRTKLVRRGAVTLAVACCAVALLVGALLTGLGRPRSAAAWTPLTALAGAQPFAVLAGGTVRAAGTSSIDGDVGGASVSGLDGQVGGTVRTGDDIAHPLADLSAADDTLTSRPATAKPSTIDGRLGPGTYAFTGDVDVTGSVVLDAGGDPDALFVIRSGSTITTTGDATVALAGGARACNVFWLATDSATVGGTVVGNIVARDRITADSRSTITGRLLSRGGDVRLDTATVRTPTDCTSDTATTPRTAADPTATGPTAADPSTADPSTAGGGPTAPAAVAGPGAGEPDRAGLVGGTAQGAGGARASGGAGGGDTGTAARHATASGATDGTGRSNGHTDRATTGADRGSGASRDTAASRPAGRSQRTAGGGGTTRDTDNARTGDAGAGGSSGRTGSGADDTDDPAGGTRSLGDRIRDGTGVGVGFGSG